MCTLTLLRRGDRGFRLAFNRDERRDRVAGEPCRVDEIDGITIVAPRDPEGGGTWIAANDHGLAVAILNGNPPPERRSFDAGGASRGRLVMAAAGTRDLDAAEEAVRRASVAVRRPFRLLATDGVRILRAGISLDPGRTPLRVDMEEWRGRPVMLASSGIGDHLVEPRRRACFDAIFAGREGDEDPAPLQDAFHASVAPLRPHVAVRTNRPEARTVSSSVVEHDVPNGTMTLIHRDLPGDGDAPESPDVRTLTLVHGVVG